MQLTDDQRKILDSDSGPFLAKCMRWLVEWGDALLGNTDPEYTDYVVDQADTVPAASIANTRNAVGKARRGSMGRSFGGNG